MDPQPQFNPHGSGWRPLPEDDQAPLSHSGQSQIPALQTAEQPEPPVAGTIYKDSFYSSGAQPANNQAVSTPLSAQAGHTQASKRNVSIFRFALIIVLGAVMAGCAMLILERLLWTKGWSFNYPYPTYAPISFLITIPLSWWLLKGNLRALLILVGTAMILGLFLADGSQIMFDLGSSNDFAPIPMGIIILLALVLLWQSMNKSHARSPFSERKDSRNDFTSPLRGRVVDFQERFEDKRTADKDVRITVWSFRLERYGKDDVRLAPIPVQMRGEAFTGFISNGNTVQLYGNKWREGQLFKTDRVINVTNKIEVKATKATMTSGKAFMYVAGLLIWLLMLAFLAGLFFLR
ncbi:MAG: hypothetical protein R3293_15420 [Candidatus Promineifilaceae bacterium]|nr:hypothetical protein [Candidatus Promineifilaceae bacterium]